MSLYTWHHQGPCKPSSRATFTLNSYWSRAAQAKKSLASMCAGLLRQCPTHCDPVDCGLPGFPGRKGISPSKNTGAYWPILVAIPFQSTIFPAALAVNSLEYLVLPEPLQPKQLHHSTPGPHRGELKSSRTTLGANPSGQPTCRGGNKTTIETQGPGQPSLASVAKEEDTKLSHQLYKLQIKSTYHLGRLCVYGIFKRSLRVPTKEKHQF